MSLKNYMGCRKRVWGWRKNLWCCRLELVKIVVLGSSRCCGAAASGVPWRVEVIGVAVE